MTQIWLLAEIVAKATLLLVAAFAAAVLLWRASAAVRHFLWTAAFTALLLLPLVMVAVPQLRVPAPSWTRAALEQTAAAGSAASPSAVLVVRAGAAKSPVFPWLVLWALGATVAAVRFAAGAVRTRGIVRRAVDAAYAAAPAEAIASELGIRRRVVVLESVDAPVPLACGIVRPCVVLPANSDNWPEARLRTVLRHELTHIRRSDLAAQMLAQVGCCLYWFHPMIWLAARRLRAERERACDDAVLAGGIAPHEYAEDLVTLARGLAGRRHAWVDTPAMAETCDLEHRVRALLDQGRNRRPLSAKAAAVTGAVTLALLLSVAALTVHAQAALGGLAGIVQDPHGARVPSCRVVAKNQNGTNEERTTANLAGEYRFAAIPQGQYVLEFIFPGFALTKVNATVSAGQATRLDGTLEMGAATEALTVSGRKPPTVVPNIGKPQRIKVGGNVQPHQLVQQVKPEYPADLQQAGVQGTVVIRAVISKDGNVLSPQVINTVDPRLAQLALDAFKQWRYQPSLLDGEPVETATTITIDFKLD